MLTDSIELVYVISFNSFIIFESKCCNSVFMRLAEYRIPDPVGVIIFGNVVAFAFSVYQKGSIDFMVRYLDLRVKWSFMFPLYND